ncbi:MAG: endolytic transglycosylase MltG [Alphaproteobacteria bacterium]|nr:endolytic transglycosylase MltG [Alphaproteobacteria bacterium]
MSKRKLEPELPNAPRSIRPRSPAEMLEPSRAPSRPKGRRRRRDTSKLSRWVRFVSSVLTIALVVIGGVGLTMFVLQHQFTAPGPLAEARTIIIPRGEGRLEIAERLEREGIVGNRWSFIVNHLARTYILGDRLDMKAGEFQLEANASMESVMKTLVRGKSVQYKITVPEGLTSQQVVARILADDNLTGDIAAIPEEGTLLPDTYPYSRGADRQAVLDRMVKAQQEFLDGLWDKRQEGIPLKSIEDAVILASIVEKETAVAEERAMTAAVFHNRLNKGMRLQSDPTIIYGIVGGRGRLGRPILKSEIRAKTPYNTYTIKGLPPTPICNPGREAILAVLNPAATKALYFVADGTGGHKFSNTLAEHNAAVANWRKIERQRRAAAKKAKAAGGGPVRTVSPAAGGAVAAAPVVPVDDREAQAAVSVSQQARLPANPDANARSSGVVTTVSSPAGVSAAAAAAGGIPLPDRKPR